MAVCLAVAFKRSGVAMKLTSGIKAVIDVFFKILWIVTCPFAKALGWWRYCLTPFWKGVVVVLAILVLVVAILVGAGWFILYASYPQ